MKKQILVQILVLELLVPITKVYAGVDGNGGGAIECDKSTHTRGDIAQLMQDLNIKLADDQTILSAYDLYQGVSIPQVDANGETSVVELKSPSDFPGYLEWSKNQISDDEFTEEIIISVMSRLKKYNSRAAVYVQMALDEITNTYKSPLFRKSQRDNRFKTAITQLENTDLPVPNNANNLITPSGCKYVGVVSWNENQIFIDSTRFEKLSPMHKAALIIHEAIYKTYRLDKSLIKILFKQSGELKKLSQRKAKEDEVRNFGALLFAKHKKIIVNSKGEFLNPPHLIEPSNLDYPNLFASLQHTLYVEPNYNRMSAMHPTENQCMNNVKISIKSSMIPEQIPVNIGISNTLLPMDSGEELSIVVNGEAQHIRIPFFTTKDGYMSIANTQIYFKFDNAFALEFAKKMYKGKMGMSENLSFELIVEAPDCGIHKIRLKNEVLTFLRYSETESRFLNTSGKLYTFTENNKVVFASVEINSLIMHEFNLNIAVPNY